MCYIENIYVIENEEHPARDELHPIVPFIFSMTKEMKHKYENPEKGDNFNDTCIIMYGDSHITWQQFLEIWNTTELDVYRLYTKLTNIEVIVDGGECVDNHGLGICAGVKTNDDVNYWMTVTFKPILEEKIEKPNYSEAINTSHENE
jgi:hypothetical protein